MKCVALILSGGTGSRMKMDIPKQYIEVGGRMIITESISRLAKCDVVDAIHVVADDAWHNAIVKECMALESIRINVHGFSRPGANRQLSILNGLTDISRDYDENTLVVIHDAARPLVTGNLISRCINACRGHDGVMPVIPMKDTVYYSEDGESVSSLLNRDRIFAGQAPEVFVLGRYLDACRFLLPDKILDIRGSTEPAVMAGLDIVMIPGEEQNFKITTREDLDRYRKIIS